MFRIVLSLLGLVSVPILVFLSWRGWTKSLRAELPAWRNGLCVSALLLLLLNWVTAAALEVPVFVSPRSARPADLMQVMLALSHPLSIVVIVLALAFRRSPRIEVIVAALLMLASWPLGYV